MIQSKKELEFYIAADRIMNGRSAKRTLKEMVGDYISSDWGGGNYQVLMCNADVCLLCECRQKKAILSSA